MLEITAVVSSLVVLSVICILLNSFSIYIIKTSTKFREKPSAALIINLLMTHMFQAIFVFPLYAGKKLNQDKEWKNFFSSGFRFTNMLSFYGACFAILCISLDRFLATYLLTGYRSYATFKNIMKAITLAWIYAVLLCVIPFIPQSKDSHDTGSIAISTGMANTTIAHDSLSSQVIDRSLTENNIAKINSKFQDMVDKKDASSANPIGTSIPPNSGKKKHTPYSYVPQKEWTVFMLLFNAALPLGIIISCYAYIISRLKQLNQLDLHNRKEENKKEFDRYKQITYLTLILSATYTVCWSPSIIYYTILHLCHDKCFPKKWDNSFDEKHIVYVIKYLTFVNAMISPIIYCFHQHPEVQKILTKLRNFLSWRTVSPTGNFDNYKVEMKDAKLGDITVTVQQTYCTTASDIDESQAPSVGEETVDDAKEQ